MRLGINECTRENLVSCKKTVSCAKHSRNHLYDRNSCYETLNHWGIKTYDKSQSPVGCGKKYWGVAFGSFFSRIFYHKNHNILHISTKFWRRKVYIIITGNKFKIWIYNVFKSKHPHYKWNCGKKTSP